MTVVNSLSIRTLLLAAGLPLRRRPADGTRRTRRAAPAAQDGLASLHYSLTPRSVNDTGETRSTASERSAAPKGDHSSFGTPYPLVPKLGLGTQGWEAPLPVRPPGKGRVSASIPTRSGASRPCVPQQRLGTR